MAFTAHPFRCVIHAERPESDLRLILLSVGVTVGGEGSIPVSQRSNQHAVHRPAAGATLVNVNHETLTSAQSGLTFWTETLNHQGVPEIDPEAATAPQLCTPNKPTHCGEAGHMTLNTP